MRRRLLHTRAGTFNVEATFGGLEYDADGKITKATAIAYSYLLEEAAEGSADRTAAVAWEDQLNILIGPKWTDWTVRSRHLYRAHTMPSHART